MQFLGLQLTSSQQFKSKEEVEKVLEVTVAMEPYSKGEKYTDILKDKVIASLFYEPSTRTRLSFETACNRLGARVVSVVGTENSSIKKGEALEDTIKMIEQYADMIIMRHPEGGAAERACKVTKKPFLNAGDGPNQHPTQSLLDIYTIKKEQGKIDGLNVAMVGDLKFGRTVHSLSQILKFYNINLFFVSPKELRMPEKVTKELDEFGIKYQENDNLEEILSQIDVLYMTRVQEERFENKEDYLKLRDSFILDKPVLKNAKKNLSILHPLPRITEIKQEVDELPYASYFKQAGNAVPTRMALIALAMGIENDL